MNVFYNTVVKVCRSNGNLLEYHGSIEQAYPLELKEEPHKTEKHYQKFFYSHLHVVSVLIERMLTFKEPEMGDGFVDFCTIFDGYKIAIELKLTRSPRWETAAGTQLKTYMERFQTDYGIYILIVEHKNHTSHTKQALLKILNENNYFDPSQKVTYIIIDVRWRSRPSVM